jgi:hypothetical protein
MDAPYSRAAPVDDAIRGFMAREDVRKAIAAELRKDAGALGEVAPSTYRRCHSFMLKDFRVVCSIGGEAHTVRVFEHMKVGASSSYTVEGVARGDILATLD